MITTLLGNKHYYCIIILFNFFLYNICQVIAFLYVCRTVCEWQLSNSQQPPMQTSWTKRIQFSWVIGMLTYTPVGEVSQVVTFWTLITQHITICCLMTHLTADTRTYYNITEKWQFHHKGSLSSTAQTLDMATSQDARWSRDSRLLEWIFTLRSQYWLINKTWACLLIIIILIKMYYVGIVIIL